MTAALFRYTFAAFLHSQRYAAPVLLFLGLLAVLTSSDSGPLVSVYAACAGALLPASAWLTASLVGVEDPVSRSVVVVTSGRSRDVLIATVVVAMTCGAALAVIGLAYPIVSGPHTVTPAALLVGYLAELTCALVGIAAGLLSSRLVLPRPGWSVLAGMALVLAVLITKGASPVYLALHAMGEDRSAASLLGPMLAYLAMAAGVLVAASAATEALATRRG